MTRFDEIRARTEAATPGPWTPNLDDVEAGVYTDEAYPECIAENITVGANVEFIAHARVDVPWLLDRLQAVLDLHAGTMPNRQVDRRDRLMTVPASFKPLASGFNYRPSTPDDELDAEAKARVLEGWAEFDRSQWRAHIAMRSAVLR